MACTKLRTGSCVLLGLAFLSWVICLGGLGSMNWLVCTDSANTAAALGGSLSALGGASAVGHDIAVCSRSWRWEWWTLFFTFAIIVSAAVVSAMPSRLLRARYPLANLMSIAAVLIMWSLNTDITAVWAFWDVKPAFSAWEGNLKKLYMSAAALVAGWVLVVIFLLVWVAFTLDFEADEEPAAAGAAPITNDVEASRKN